MYEISSGILISDFDRYLFGSVVLHKFSMNKFSYGKVRSNSKEDIFYSKTKNDIKDIVRERVRLND